MSEENTTAQIEALATELQPVATPLQMLTAQIAATIYVRKSGLAHGTLLNQHDIILGAVKEAAELARTILAEVQD